MFHLFISAALLILTYTISAQTDTAVFSVVTGKNVKGYFKEWKNHDGSWESLLQYNDRGRGDSIHITYREDEQGFPVYAKTAGVDYMKNQVGEEFQWNNGNAKWKNNSEDEELSLPGKAYFLGLYGNSGHMLKAFRANNNTLKLLPLGEAHIKTLATYQLKHGEPGKKVYLMEQTGLNYTPEYSWIDGNNNDFAFVNNWTSLIRRGCEGAVEELLNIQKSYADAFFTELAKTLPQHTDAGVLIRAVAVFDAQKAQRIEGRDVLIRNGMIEKIAAANTLKVPGAEIIDGTGKTLLPGLWDMHTHLNNNTDGILHIAAGVTHVRDMGNGPELLVKQQAIFAKTLIGPRIDVMSGFIDAVDPMAAPTGVLINSVEEGKKAIRDYKAKGYQQIKLYSSIKPGWVKPMVDEAHWLGMRVCGHIPAFMTATQAVNWGYDEITHMNMLALNFFGDTIDTRTPLRFSVPAQRTASLDINGAAMAEFIALLKRKNIAVDPTLMTFEDMFTAREKVVAPKFVPIVSRLPATMQRYIRAGGNGLPIAEGMDETYKKSFDVFLKILKRLYDAGLRILPGTDDIAGFGLQRELELYVQAGIPAPKVLQIATWGPAVYTGNEKVYGNVSVGKAADLVLVNGDPTVDISQIRNTVLVFAHGLMYNPGKLYEAISIKPL